MLIIRASIALCCKRIALLIRYHLFFTFFYFTFHLLFLFLLFFNHWLTHFIPIILSFLLILCYELSQIPASICLFQVDLGGPWLLGGAEEGLTVLVGAQFKVEGLSGTLVEVVHKQQVLNNLEGEQLLLGRDGDCLLVLVRKGGVDFIELNSCISRPWCQMQQHQLVIH